MEKVKLTICSLLISQSLPSIDSYPTKDVLKNFGVRLCIVLVDMHIIFLMLGKDGEVPFKKQCPNL